METNKKQVGMRIKDIRLSLGESMEEFGKRFDTSKGTVNNWEKGRNLPNKSNLLKIAKLGEMTPSELLKGKTATIPFQFPSLNDILYNPSKDYIRECYEIITFNTSDRREEDIIYTVLTGVRCILDKIPNGDSANRAYIDVLNRSEWVAVETFLNDFFAGGGSLEFLSYPQIVDLRKFLQELVDYKLDQGRIDFN
ncbi:helix-turn-helix transcriptional regulator [Streptococcus thermophilus]|uniref:helix-turn-helix domain-containing protein n=1 Tax=Streptococcus thermophilus TaxID=1308 RepID=UPI0019D10964|nr:helix-turn-helix transcriptional regulator [Streptococcus thermophilus]MBN6047451.1 helix-turn-helix transcriptional regulator [Streptococcus thermophilus]